MHHQSAKDFFSQREILIYLSSYPSSINFFSSVPDLNLTTTDPAKYHFLIRLNALASSKKAFPAFWAVLSAAPA